MLSKRVIACLDVRDGQVVKGINFEGLRTAGDPAELARRYNAEGVDELVILDITATLERRRALADTIRAVARELFIPLAVGGGIRTEADAAAAVDAGADKVSLNTAALSNPSLITTLAERYGSQAVLVAIDAKWEGDRAAVYVRSGSTPGNRDAVEWAKEAEARQRRRNPADRSIATLQDRIRLQAHRRRAGGVDSNHCAGRRRRLTIS
jgi:cyclase